MRPQPSLSKSRCFQRQCHSIVLTLLCVILCISPLQAETTAPLIYIISTNEKEDARIQQLQTALSQQLTDNTVQTISIKQLGDIERADDTVFIAAGSNAFKYLLSQNVKQAVIGVFISRVSYQQIRLTQKSMPKNAYVVASDPSPMQQLALIRTIYDEKIGIGVLLSERTDFLTKDLHLAAQRLGLRLRIRKLKTTLKRDMRMLLRNYNVETLLALPDSNIFNAENIQIITRLSVRYSTPIIGYSPQLVNSGGLATVYFNIEQIADSTVTIVRKLRKHRWVAKLNYPTKFDIRINRHARRALNLRSNSGEKIKQKMQSILRATQQ